MRINSQLNAADVAADLNSVAAFLAANDFPENEVTAEVLRAVIGTTKADALVLLGNAVLHTSDKAFELFRQGIARRLLISGGRGHSTEYLYSTLQKDPLFQQIDIGSRAESELLAEIATQFRQIPSGGIELETASSNCGENAAFSYRFFAESGDVPTRLILVQDPTMQRRSTASFRKVWSDAGCHLRVANFPTFVPRVIASGSSLMFDNPGVSGLWPMERFLRLILGEIPRLRDDANGYGPLGTGYIGHVDIPAEVDRAHARLVSEFSAMMR